MASCRRRSPSSSWTKPGALRTTARASGRRSPACRKNALRGGQPGRSAQGRRLRTRPVGSIDRGVSLNRALWVLAEEMRKLRADRQKGRRASPLGVVLGKASRPAEVSGGFAGFDDLVGCPSPKTPEREHRPKVAGARARLALFPVVDRLRRRTDQKAALGR